MATSILPGIEGACIVTGAGSGIGAACALVLATQGGKVCIVDRDEDAAARTQSALRDAGANAITVVGDVRDPATAERAVRAALNDFGGLTVLVNNAGGMFQASSSEITDNGWSAVIRANLDSAFYFCRAAGPAMLERGGTIVNIASVAGVSASPGAAHYGAAKAGLINLTRSLALEWAPRVRVNCVAPDFIRTEGTERLMAEEYREKVQQLIPLSRLGTPNDVAWAVAFLCSDLASFITGETVVVDGGSLHRARLDFQP